MRGCEPFAAFVRSTINIANTNTMSKVEPSPTNKYTVAIYYWPNFHPDAHHQMRKGDGWTEWEIVKSAKPQFPGHNQPKVPLWGYYDESDPQAMARSIDAMADAGIGAVIFDWYRYQDDIDGGVMIERALRDGFLKAPNRHRVKFSLMWANHTYIDCHPFAPGKNFDNATVWRPGEVNLAAFQRHTQDAIENYFTEPNYWKIDGCPYFSIYDLSRLIVGLGGVEATRQALDDFRQRVKLAGFPDLHLNFVDAGLAMPELLKTASGQPWPGDPSRKIESILDLFSALNADSSTMYTWVHHLWPLLVRESAKPGSGAKSKAFGFSDDPSRVDKPHDAPAAAPANATPLEHAANAGIVAMDYADYGARAMSLMDERPAELGVTYFPHVSMGWDGSPRNYSMGMVLNNTPEKWAGFLRQAKDWLDRHPESRGIVTLNSWNEWVEGSYIEPDTVHGMKYLDGVRDVFGVPPEITAANPVSPLTNLAR
jgi:hypothetical protein